MPLKAAIGSALPKLRLKLVLPNGNPVDLTGQSVKLLLRKRDAATPSHEMAAAKIAPETGGVIEVDSPGSVITEPGDWIATGLVTYPGGATLAVPADPEDGLEIYAASPLSVFSNIEEFRSPLRFLLQDFDPAAPLYSNQNLDDGVRAALRLGVVPGYTLTPSRQGITPVWASETDFGLCLLETARLFVAGHPDRQSIRTREASESVGNYRDLLRVIEDRIGVLKGDDAGFNGWQSFYSFLIGVQGLPAWQVLSGVSVHAPFTTYTIGVSGHA